MATKIKPQRVEANNSPQVGYVPQYVDDATFEWGPGGDGGGAGGITAYTIEDGTINGTTPVVVSDSRIELDTPFNIYYESEPVGNITRTLGAGSITLVSDNPADTMNFRLVIFGFGNKTTYVQSDVIELDGEGPRVITDSRISADTPVNLFPLQEPTGYLTIVAGDGEVTISSSASETNLEVRYIGFTELKLGEILNDTYGIDWATDETNGASRKAIYDKIESIETEIQNVQILAKASMEMIIDSECNGVTTDGEYDYITFAGIVKKYDKNLKFIASLNVASAGVPKYHNGYLYVGSSNAVAKIDPATMTLVDTEAVTGFNGMELVGNYLICACNDSNFRRIDLTTFNVDLTVANGWINVSGMCTDGTYLYVSQGSGVYKINVTTLTQVSNYFDGTSTFGPIVYASGNLFVVKVSGGSNEIRRIETAGMTNLGAGGIGGNFGGITTDGINVYSRASFGSGVVYYYIMKYDVSTASSYLMARRSDNRYATSDVAKVIGYGTGLFIILQGGGYTLKI